MTQTNVSAAKAGFTLLELMIALSLTSMLSLVAYMSLGLSVRALQHGQTAAEHIQELRVAQTILARSLSSAARGSLQKPVYFVGNATDMRFFTPVPLEAHNLGGIYHWRVLAGQEKSEPSVLAVEQTKNLNWFRDPEGVEVRQILLDHLTGLRFAYGQGDREVETWDGAKAGALPDWVRVYLTQKGRNPMVLFIPIHVSDYKNETSQ